MKTPLVIVKRSVKMSRFIAPVNAHPAARLLAQARFDFRLTVVKMGRPELSLPNGEDPLNELPSHDPETPPVAPPPQGEIELKLKHVERVLLIRIGVSAALYAAFALLDVSAALTHTVGERAPLLLGLLIAAIFALPRQVIRTNLFEQARHHASLRERLKRLRRIRIWLVRVRAVYFFGALALFLGLPKLV